ncbi:O-antigen/teichoic acid export membrane protein [Paenibacillus turicensis]|uniref:O-antigen/teichoic acid export membrane protein n=1 Tax=Paenibacillus turicensis TaxID=160487 RepID=A0ABS4FXW2_9BACL|nr:polysaccharide biosynthesis protein [Paenibacillus turicensis]MBP1907360.1 O-antigen/teichoic acid export membrane protein [Paenibacillus turicensis]
MHKNNHVSKKRSSGLLKGAVVLTAAAIITKLLGTLQKIPLQNIGGDSVFGIYNTVYPFYNVAIIIATAGFPTAIAKFVAERELAQNGQGQCQVLSLATWVLVILGSLSAITLYLGAPLISVLIGTKSIIPALQACAPALLFVPLSAGLRGYFQGLQDMVPTAISQVIEQFVRVGVMIVLLLYFHRLQASDDVIAGGALAGSAVGGFAGLLVMLLYWIQYKRGINKIPTPAQFHFEVEHPSKPNHYSLLKEMLRYAWPICLAALAVPLISLVDTFTLPRLLGDIHGEAYAMYEIGVYNRGIPLVQLVTMIASSLSVLFIPRLAQLKLVDNQEGIRQQSILALRWCWLIGLASSMGLALLAEPINVMLYKDDVGTGTLAWIAWTAAPGALAYVSAALLQGIGRVHAPAVHLLIAASMKLGLNLILVPLLGRDGAAISGIGAYMLAAGLNIYLLWRLKVIKLNLRQILMKPMLACLVMSIGLLILHMFIYFILPEKRIIALVHSLVGVCLGVILFGLTLLKSNFISQQELLTLPKIGPKLVKLIGKLKR